MDAGANREAQLGQVGHCQLDELALQRPNVVPPLPRLRIVPGVQLGRQPQAPGPAVHPLERQVFLHGKVVGFALERCAAEMGVQPPANLRSRGVIGIELQQSDQHPVPVHAAVPVKAAEKRGVQLARAQPGFRPCHHVLRLVGILFIESRQRQFCKGRDLLARQLPAERGPLIRGAGMLCSHGNSQHREIQERQTSSGDKRWSMSGHRRSSDFKTDQVGKRQSAVATCWTPIHTAD